MAVVAVTPANADDVALTGKLLVLFQQAQNRKRPRIAVWDRNYRMLFNKAWGAGRPNWMASPALSNIYAIGDAWVAWMTDRHPLISCVPAADATTQLGQFWAQIADDLSLSVEVCWSNYLWDAEIERVLWDGYLYGTGFLKAMWDKSLNEGLGDATMRRIDPYSIFPDPAATSDTDLNYIFEVRTLSLQELDRRFPGAADKFQEFTEVRLETRPDIYQGSQGPARANPAALPGGTPIYGQPGQAGQSVYADKGVTLYECWVREHEVKKDKNGDEFIDDHWRVICFAGNHVLLDELATDLFNHGHHPYSRYVLQDTGEYWGMSIVEHLVPLQDSVNRLLASMQNNAELIGNPVLKEDSRSGVQRQQVVNRPGMRHTIAPGSTFEWMKPPEMPNFISELIKFYLSEMERISGLSAMNRGMTPQGRNSADVLDSIQEAGFVRIRGALRNLERTLQQQGQMVASLITEFYTTPRIVATVGTSGQQTMNVLRGRHFYLPSDDNKDVPIRFNLLVDVGSATATSRSSRIAEADRLYAMGAIDRIAVLDAHNYPGRHEITKRMMEMEKAGFDVTPNARQRKTAAK